MDVELVFRRPQGGTSVAQQNIINDLMVTGVKGIAISPNDAANLQDFLKNKVASKIPLVTQDNDVPDASVRRCYIGTHNYRAGRAAGALVEKAVPKGGKIAIFVGQMDAPNAVERRQGLLDYLAGKQQTEIGDKTPPDAANLTVGKYTLVGTRTDDSSETNCKNKADELLLLHPDIDCMIGLWEYNPPAILRAVRPTKSKTAIVGFDENFQTLEGIQSGEIFGTVVQNPYQFGYESIKILAGLAKGDDSVLKSRKDIDAQNRIYIPHRIIMKDAGKQVIDGTQAIDVEVFFPEVKKLKEGK
jgi:ribose transport system substrate-binding protein